MTPRAFQYSFASIYPHYVNKVEKKGKTKAQLDEIIEWLFGYDATRLATAIEDERDMQAFVTQAPAKNPNRRLIKGVVCGVRVEDIEDPVMQEIRYLDKLVDELARGKKYENIFRG
ncbi:MAG: DUF2200 domain-containing protein [Pseudomonadota bacterium]